MSVYRGSCHCGAVGFEYRTEQPVGEWFVRTCGCSFCVMHGGIYTSDPTGSLRFTHDDPAALSRYRFGHKTADFVFCGHCGGYLGAVMDEAGQTFMVINLRVLDPRPEGLPPAKDMSYEEETAEIRVTRRAARWTPVLG